MTKDSISLLLADDDMDDCIFFKEALEELPHNVNLAIVNDGEELMQWLNKHDNDLPNMLFLDLNMPRKTGYECLTEIKLDTRLKHIPVIILSTSFDHDSAGSLYSKGAQYYIRKPGEFSKLRELLKKAISLASDNNMIQPSFGDFVLHQ